MNKTFKPTTIALMISFLALLDPAKSIAESPDKMPITTSSKEALDNYLKGRDLNEKLRGQEARQFFQKAINLDPNFAVAHLQIAGVQASPKAFFESYNKARALVDKVSEAEKLWIFGFEAGAIDGDPMKQRKYMKELVSKFPNDERAHNLLAANYFGQQEWKSAIAEYEKAIAINPNFSAPYNQLGYAYRFMEDFDNAEKTFMKYIELIPDDPNPYDSYAELLMKLGRFDESIEQYKGALKVNPDFVFSHAGIATNLNFKGEHEAARKQLQFMYDNARDDGQRRTALTATAWSFVDEGNFGKGVEAIQKQYVLDEKRGDISAMAADLVLMGYIVIEVEGRESEALELFKKASAMVQASSVADKVKAQNIQTSNFNIGRAYTAMRDFENAKIYAAKFRERATKVQNGFQLKQAHQLDGLIALGEGDYDTSIKELMQTNLINPYNNFFLAKAYQAKGQLAKAKEYFEDAGHCNSLNGGPQACVRVKAQKESAAL